MIIRTFFSVFCICTVTFVAQGQSWSSLRPGLEVEKGSFADRGQRVSFVMLRCDPRKRQIRIVDMARELDSASAFSLAALNNKTKALALVNAGSTASFNFPSPVGWLRISGKDRSKPNFQVRQPGVLCISNGRLSIFELSSTRLPSCVDAVQRGPFLPRNFAPIHGFSDGAYRRTIAAVDGENRLLLLVTNDPASFSAIVSFLYSSQSGLDVQSAFGLDSAASSGLLVSGANSESPDGGIAAGNINQLVASAIAIY